MKFVFFYFILKISISFGKHIRKDLPVVPIQNFQPPTEQIDLSASNEVPFSKSFEEHLNFHDENVDYSPDENHNHHKHKEEIFYTNNIFSCFKNFYSQIFYITTCRTNKYKCTENNIKVIYHIKDKLNKVILKYI